MKRSAPVVFCRERTPWRSVNRKRTVQERASGTARSPFSTDRRDGSQRGGYALVELLVVISVNSVLMAVAVGLIGTLLRTEHQGQHHWERTSTLVRLADQFRADVAAAGEARLVAGNAKNAAPPQLRLQSGADQAVEYSHDGERIRRVEYQGDGIARREAYHLIDLAKVEFVVPDTPIVTLRLTFGEDAVGTSEVSNIEARLAKDRRFAVENEP